MNGGGALNGDGALNGGGCTRMPLRIRGTTNSACASDGLASTSATIIHFGEGQAETSQARQRLGVSCDLLSAYQVA